MSYFNFTPYGPGLTPTDISQVSNDNFYRLKQLVDNLLPVGSVTISSLISAPEGWLVCDGAAVSRDAYNSLFQALNPKLGTFTITIATPGVGTLSTHGLTTGDRVYIQTTGALPTGLTANTAYFAILVDANTFRLATSKANADAGTAINTSGSQSGVHTLYRSPYGIGNGTTTFNIPDLKGKIPVGLDTSQTEFDAIAETGGAKTHTLTTSEIPSHTHTAYAPNNDVNSSASQGYPANNNHNAFRSSDRTRDYALVAAAISNTGGGAAHNNLQPYVVMNYIIKY